MKRKISIFFFVGFVLIGTGVWWKWAQTQSISVDGRVIRVDIARTQAERERGLGGRDSLGSDQGMLFVFDTDGNYPFWMKNMRFPIDIVWIAAQGTIVAIAPQVATSTYPATFLPASLSRYILELPSGYTEAHGIKNGDIVTLPKLSSLSR